MSDTELKQSNSIISKLLALKLKAQFLLLMAFMVCGFAIAGVIGDRAFNRVLVNGPVYVDIVSNKDLVADILPPPAYLLESWQVALEMAAIKDQPLQPLVEKSNQLAIDFATRAKYWDETITDPKMHEVMKTQLQPSGEAFLRIRDSVFIPAVRSGNADAIDAALVELKTAYEKHRNAVDIVVSMATEQSKGIEARVNAEIPTARTTVLALVLIALSCTLVGIFFVVTHMIRQLGGEPNEINRAARRVATGDLEFVIPLATNDRSSAMAAMSSMQDKIKLLVSDAAMLSQAAVDGRLSTRADANRHQGDFRKVISGVNATLDSVIGPLHVAANYVDRISKGDIPARITNTYNGDFNTIKNNLNACIDAVNKVAADAAMLSQAAVEGRLETRADATQHQGDFRKIVDGVNHTLDAVISPLNVAAGYVDNFAKGVIPANITDSYNGDFNIIKTNLNACIDGLSLLVADANMLATAAQEGKLDARADATKHRGDYRKVVEGVNATLDAVMLKNAADAVEKSHAAQVLESAVAETQDIIEGAKAGDLTGRVSLQGKTGAIASLCDGVNALLDKMTEVIMQVREAGETINTAASEISTGNNDLSNRTEQQASSLEETASSMEELASTVKQNAENAKQANQLAATASSVAVKGGTVVNEVITTMVDINASSRKIEDIISVIDGIAFQTNILALNAAVEAARAGEQGRGFAVVAGEVRNLAQRSAGAAKEIKQLISDSVAKVQNGTKLVEDAGKTMGEIVSSVQRVTDIMGEITAASVEQSAGIDQVNHAITSMDEVTQQNAALVEEAAAAAESLVEQAVSLMETVSVFKLNGGASFTANKAASRSSARMPQARLASAKPAAKLAAAKKTGTNDGDWEEF